MPQVVSGPDCLNCGAALNGPFCHACGQRVAAAPLGLPDVLNEATQEFLNVDSEILKTLATLLTRPGQLTQEFIAGRRARYISLLRLYLTVSVVFFFALTVVPGGQSSVMNVTTSDTPARSGVRFGPAPDLRPASPELRQHRDALSRAAQRRHDLADGGGNRPGARMRAASWNLEVGTWK